MDALSALALLSRLFERLFLSLPVAALAAALALHAAGLVPSLADETLLEVVAEATLAFVYVGAALLAGTAATWRERLLLG